MKRKFKKGKEIEVTGYVIPTKKKNKKKKSSICELTVSSSFKIVFFLLVDLAFYPQKVKDKDKFPVNLYMPMYTHIVMLDLFVVLGAS